MPFFPADAIDSHLQKKLLIGGIIPRPIGLILTQNQAGLVNLAPFSYFNIVSFDPPVLGVSIQRQEDGSYKDTARNLLDLEVANVHMVDRDLLEAANQAAAPLGPNESELARTNLVLQAGQLSTLPVIQAAKVTYECRLLQQVPVTKDGDRVACDLFLLEVLGTQVLDLVYDADRDYIIASKFDPISRLAGNDYADLGREWTLERPQS
ncbi:flavin reductase family protein [Hutsoniella sourekii]|uniref:flavin reductase family protein n=1 Tax=Hutsoniella sourekii TaxID=87650 RepID=UPI0004BAD94E|nr:flavin reductase family protein [Hutsoniella sourekii]